MSLIEAGQSKSGELQSQSPLCQLSNMEARTVFELMLQRGCRLVAPKSAEGITWNHVLPIGGRGGPPTVA